MDYIIKRNGQKEQIQFDKITKRIERLIKEEELSYLNPILIAQKVIASIYSGITTEELDIEAADICVNLSTVHPSYSLLGGRILISNLHKKTSDNFCDKMLELDLNDEFKNYVKLHYTQLNEIICYDRDFNYDYFGFKTLEKSYLLQNERPQDMLLRCAVTLQMGDMEFIRKTYNYMSLGYYTHASPTLFNAGTKHQQLSSCFLLQTFDSLDEITKTWNSCAQISKWAGGIGLGISNIRANNSLIKGTNGKSNGIVPFLKVFNDIARWIDQGGRRPGSIAIYLEPSHPDIFEYLDLRKNFGSETERARDLFYAMWIPDLFMQLVEDDGDWYLLSPDECPGLEKVYGKEYADLYYGYVIENKYRKKIKARKLWQHILETQIETGMPYIAYKDHINRKSNQKNIGVIRSSNLCIEICEYSDHNEYAVCNLASINLKSFVNKCSFNNFTIYTKPDCKFCKYAKNYLNSLNISFEEVNFDKESFDKLKIITNRNLITYPQIFHDNKLIGGFEDLYNYITGEFDYDKLYDVAYLATVNLNKVIDINYYPVPQAKLSNMKHRPIGLGIQGLADCLCLLKIPFDSEKAIEFNKKYMETIYLAGLTASNDIAKERFNEMKILKDLDLDYPEFYNLTFGKNNDLTTFSSNNLYHKLKPNIYEIKNNKFGQYGAYSSFSNSPFSKGQLQFDMWSVDSDDLFYKDKWKKLKESIKIYGTRNSLITALMPTASTSQILGNNECFEPFTNNIYTRKTNAGDFILVNKYLVNDLIYLNLWNKELKDKIIADDGSVQNIDIPLVIKNMYKTVWEIKQIWLLKASLARSPFIDQMQSLNIFMAEPDFQRLNSSHFWGWKNGLKTGMYYLRSKPSSNAIKFTIDPTTIKECDNCGS